MGVSTNGGIDGSLMVVFMMIHDGFHDVIHIDINGGVSMTPWGYPTMMVYFMENPKNR